MNIECPRCMGDTSPVGTSHYVCNNPNCKTSNGMRTQFRVVYDTMTHFPYNQIFVTRNTKDFYREPYLEIATVSNRT